MLLLGFMFLIFSRIITICYCKPQGYIYQSAATAANELGIAKPRGFSIPSRGGYVTKQFFIHSAPDDTYDEDVTRFQKQLQQKKNLQVVVIKSPTNNGLQKAALQLAKQQSSSETIVYVLSKQTDYSHLKDKLQQLNEINPNKPEVHFVKYRTPDEIEKAQQSIQSSYDYIPGVAEVSDEGVASVISYVGSLNSYSSSKQNTNQQQQQQLEFVPSQSSQSSPNFNNLATPNVSNVYLPALA